MVVHDGAVVVATVCDDFEVEAPNPDVPAVTVPPASANVDPPLDMAPL